MCALRFTIGKFVLIFFLGIFLEAKVFAIESAATSRTSKSPNWTLILYPFLGLMEKYEKNEDEVAQAQRLRSWGLGIKYQRFFLGFENNSFVRSEGNESIGLKMSYNEYLAQVQYDWWQKGDLSASIGVAPGYYQKTVETHLLGRENAERSDMEPFMSGLLGAQVRLRWMVLAAETRAIFFNDVEPNPQFAYLLKIGFPISW